MSYVEMTIDSVRHAMHRDQWLILLKEKDGHRCLPVYVDKVWADAVGKMLRGEDAGMVIDNGLKQVIKRIGAAQLLADKLIQSNLAKAFRGELVPTEAELARQEGRSYESASVLLGRIQAERER